jgi:hypothetical protein
MRRMPMDAATNLLESPVRIERYELEPLELDIGRDFVRRTTVVHLHGAGEEGVGEDVTYEEAAQLAFHAAGPVLDLTGEYTLASFTHALPADLPDYTRWAFESAALDLALRQSGRSLAEALGRQVRPVTFVVSRNERLEAWRREYPAIRFKLDAAADWSGKRIARLAALGGVDTVDLKGHYRDVEGVGLEPDADLYARVCEGFPEAWIEDPWLDERTWPVLSRHESRLTFDAPIHAVADAESLPFRPRCLNVKPSRFGSLQRLFAFYAWCEKRGVAMYGGGQFELGPGRGQIQLLASLFHPDSPNDVAPAAYNTGGPRPGLPTSPLTLSPRATGFGLE